MTCGAPSSSTASGARRSTWAPGSTARSTTTAPRSRPYEARLDEETGEFRGAESLDSLNTGSNEGAPDFSPAGDFLYFASDCSGGFGAFDLYRARLLDGFFREAENLGAGINTRANELDPALGMAGFELHFSSDRLATGEVAEALDYDVYVSRSREVFRVLDAERLRIDWAALWSIIGPWLLWLLLLLLLLLFLVTALRNRGLRDRWGTLGLLARCLILSLLLHALLLAMLAAWQVSSSIGDFLERSGGTKVALISRSVGGDIAGQIRGGLTQLQIDPRVPNDSVRKDPAPINPAQPRSAEMSAPRAEIRMSAMAREDRASDAQPEPSAVAAVDEGIPGAECQELVAAKGLP